MEGFEGEKKNFEFHSGLGMGKTIIFQESVLSVSFTITIC